MRAAGRYGLAPVLGQCPGVGAAGVTLGGGLGWLSGLHGASCDNLLSARMFTADGRILSVDAEHNPDLLWALRGAGANFGVMTSFECRLYSLGPVTAGEIYYPVRDARSVLRFDFTTQHSRIDAGSAPGWADRNTVESAHVDDEAVGGAQPIRLWPPPRTATSSHCL